MLRLLPHLNCALRFKPVALGSSFALFGALVGCAPSQPMQTYYYQFDQPSVSNQVVFENNALPIVLMREVEISGVAKNLSMVQRLGSGETHLANYHLWATDPSKLVSHYLIKQMDSESANFVLTPYSSWTPASMQLSEKVSIFEITVSVSQLYGDNETNSAKLSGAVHIYKHLQGGRTLLSQVNFDLDETINGVGFGALVNSHQINLNKLSTLTQAAITKLIPNDKRD
ncbi:hypothetical protein PALB_18280 [Pseudoalteromonas luteoviolacea B = ATCC 29581]|nr:hypothetical protein PALB_18280 [Pseudoalteromonas luteoviolacea B = ATCC 29581]